MVEVPLKFGRWKIHCLTPIRIKNKVLRTWKERLSFSKDEIFFFNPFNKYKEVTEYHQLLEDNKTVMVEDKIYCNENTFQFFKRELDDVCSITFEKKSSCDIGDVYDTKIDFKTEGSDND